MRGAIRSVRRLTRRQLASLLLATGLAGTVAAAAALGQLTLAISAVGFLGASLFAAVVQLRRRLSLDVDAIQLEVRRSRQSIVKEIQSQSANRALAAEQVEAAHRRLLAVLENERLAAADRHSEVLAKTEYAVREVSRLQRDQGRRHQALAKDLEALLQLYGDFRPRAPMPLSGGWALNPPGLLRLLSLVEQWRPKLVLELGSGTSSVWLGYALERTGGRLVSIEHSTEYAEQTRTMLSWHGLERVAEVRHAPLRALRVDGEEFQWYADSGFADLAEVGLLVVDGPPGPTGPAARFPALPVLAARLSATATIFLDDADRPDEREILRRWSESFPGLTHCQGLAERHAVLTYSRR